jgi:8-oxo-dGTP diphosphatase
MGENVQQAQVMTDPAGGASIQVTAALIPSRGRLFIAQRPAGKRFGLCWEFPGGKLQPGESLQACLEREISEELNWKIHVEELFHCVHYRRGDLAFDLYAFWSRVRWGELELREHVACSWVRVDQLRYFPLTAADRRLIGLLEQLPTLPD